MLGLLLDGSLFLGESQTTISNVLYAAGWLIGEYAEHLSDGVIVKVRWKEERGGGGGRRRVFCYHPIKCSR